VTMLILAFLPEWQGSCGRVVVGVSRLRHWWAQVGWGSCGCVGTMVGAVAWGVLTGGWPVAEQPHSRLATGWVGGISRGWSLVGALCSIYSAVELLFAQTGRWLGWHCRYGLVRFDQGLCWGQNLADS